MICAPYFLGCETSLRFHYKFLASKIISFVPSRFRCIFWQPPIPDTHYKTEYLPSSHPAGRIRQTASAFGKAVENSFASRNNFTPTYGSAPSTLYTYIKSLPLYFVYICISYTLYIPCIENGQKRV